MVIDTMVMAYALLGEPNYGNESLNLLQSGDAIWVPDLIRPELVNVVWQWIKFKGVALDDGIAVLYDAENLFDYVIPTAQLWETSLRLSVECGIAAYDTIFVALAKQYAMKLVTYDKKLLLTFPEYTISTSDYLSSLH
jgi:predicted nucleic acid-binding protein